MKKKELEAFAKQAAKSIKSEVTKLTLEKCPVNSTTTE
jgi:hypothetical protein